MRPASSLCPDSRQRPNPSASRPAPFSATAHTPKSIAYSATALIAAKPLKPCDGGVFLGAKFALKKRVDYAWVWMGRMGRMGRMSWGLGWAWAGFDRAMRPRKQPLRRFQAAANPSASRPAPFSATARTSKSNAYSATGLIAAKPLKPCDGGVFRGLNSLSKREWRRMAGLGQGLPGDTFAVTGA